MAVEIIGKFFACIREGKEGCQQNTIVTRMGETTNIPDVAVVYTSDRDVTEEVSDPRVRLLK